MPEETLDFDRLDPPLRRWIEAAEAAEKPEQWEVDHETSRRLRREALTIYEREPEEVGEVAEISVPGGGGQRVARVYRPRSPRRPAAVLLWLHGGGFVIGDLETADAPARRLANRLGATVVSLDYRLAPEDPFPAGLDDSWAAFEWLAAGAAGLGADPGRIVVGGDSAGACLAAAVAIRARDAAIPLAHQLLVYPNLDATVSRSTWVTTGDRYHLSRDGMEWFLRLYLPTGVAPDDPEVSPLFAADLAGVASATVVGAEFDPLRGEIREYVAKLRADSVPVSYREFEGMIHGFFSMASLTDGAVGAADWVAGEVRGALDS